MRDVSFLEEPDLERRIPMSYEEWLAWEDTERQSEWVDGEAIVFMPGTTRHGRIVAFVMGLLYFYVRLRRLGEVLGGPVEVRISRRVSREPDVLFVADEHAARVTDRRVEGPADLVVEVISDDSVRRDRLAKFDEYARAGVREYWIVDPRPGRESFEAYALSSDGAFAPFAPDPDGKLRSRVVAGFWFRPEWLRQDPLPEPLACLLEIAPDALPGGR